MSNICGIYKITSPSGRVYVGQSVNIKKRFNSYKRSSAKYHPKLSYSFQKYGIENHVFEIIIECDKPKLDELEIYYIDKWNTVKKGLNCKGGGHRATLSEFSLKKLSESLKITNKRPEVKERRSSWQIGRKMSAEAILKMSNHRIGKKGHPNQIKAATGNNNAQKEPIAISKNGLIVSVEENLYKAAEFVGGDFRNVHACLKGTRNYHKGYSFKRIYESSSPAMG